jgi:hypothetical protein
MMMTEHSKRMSDPDQQSGLGRCGETMDFGQFAAFQNHLEILPILANRFMTFSSCWAHSSDWPYIPLILVDPRFSLLFPNPLGPDGLSAAADPLPFGPIKVLEGDGQHGMAFLTFFCFPMGHSVVNPLKLLYNF